MSNHPEYLQLIHSRPRTGQNRPVEPSYSDSHGSGPITIISAPTARSLAINVAVWGTFLLYLPLLMFSVLGFTGLFALLIIIL